MSFRFTHIEPIETGNKYRQDYLDGLDVIIKKRFEAAEKLREEKCTDIFTNPEKHRTRFMEMLGWPLVGEEDKSYEVAKEFVREDNGVKIYRMQTTIAGGLKVYGMLFISDENPETPMIIGAHGGLGAPELCSGLLDIGTINYNHMVERILERKVNVYAPQFLLWKAERFATNDPQMEKGETYSMRKTRDFRLQATGSSITAIELFGMQRVLDYLIDEGIAKEDKIGMMGLSYGGFYTLFLAAIDTRIKASVSCCYFYDEKEREHWADWQWGDSVNKYCNAEILELVYPRKIDICMGNEDFLFNPEISKNEFERFKKLAGDKAGYAEHIVFEGGHEVFKEEHDEIIKRLIKRVKE